MKPTKPTTIRLSTELLNDLQTIRRHLALETDIAAIRWSIRWAAQHFIRLEQRSQRRLIRKRHQG